MISKRNLLHQIHKLESQVHSLTQDATQRDKYQGVCEHRGCRVMLDTNPYVTWLSPSFFGIGGYGPTIKESCKSQVNDKFYCAAHFDEAKEAYDIEQWAKEHPDEARVCKSKGDKVRSKR